MAPVRVDNIQERAETLAAKFIGRCNQPDKPEVEQYSDELTNEFYIA